MLAWAFFKVFQALALLGFSAMSYQKTTRARVFSVVLSAVLSVVFFVVRSCGSVRGFLCVCLSFSPRRTLSKFFCKDFGFL